MAGAAAAEAVQECTHRILLVARTVRDTSEDPMRPLPEAWPRLTRCAEGQAGAFEVVGLERRYRRAHRVAEPIGGFEQFRPDCAVALADGDDAENGVAGGGDRLDL